MGTPKWTIYCHTHIESGRRYIGLTKLTMMQRWNQHLYGLKSKVGKSCRHFWNAIRKYGPESFSHEELAQCRSIDDGNAIEELIIDQYHSRNLEFGFNLMRGGGVKPDLTRSNPWNDPVYREKQTNRLVELRKDPAYGAKISSSLKTTLSSPEIRFEMSTRSKDSSTPEVVSRRSQAIKKTYEDPEVQARHRDAVVIAQNQPELLAKRRVYRATLETKLKIGAASTGKTHSLKSVEKQRELYLQRSSTCKFCGNCIEGKRSCIRGRVSCLVCYSLHREGLASFLRPDDAFVAA